MTNRVSDSAMELILRSTKSITERVVQYRARCGLAKLQPVIDAALLWLRTLMKDARGGLNR